MRKRKVERRTVTFGMPANQSPLQDWTYTIIKDYAPGDTVLVESGIPISVGPEELKRLNREFRALSKATKGAHKRPKKLGALSNRLGDHMHLIRGARAVSTHDEIIEAIKAVRGDGPSEHPWVEARLILDAVNKKLKYPTCVDTVAKKLRDYF